MLEVSQETRAAYQLDGIHKEIKIVFPDFGLTLHNNSIVSESLQLKQSIQEGDALECVGCISSSFSIQLADVVNKFVRGNRIEAYIKAGDTEEICLFKGFVDSAKKEANRKIKTIEAYDVLYKLSGQAGIPGEDEKLYDITEWYNNHGPITIEGLLRELCQKFGIQIDPNAPNLYNGHYTTECGSKRNVSSLSALDLLKNICQINACFGYITNEGLFSWKYLGGSSYDSLGNLYPSEYIYPSDNIWPGRDKDHADQRAENYLGWYMNIEYEDFIVQPIQQVIIRDTSNDENPGKTGSGKNKYIIQGNILVYGQDTSIKNQMAANIYDRLNSIGYVPFNSNNQGLPYMECGDEISYIDLTANPDTGTKIDFFIFNRTFKGCQYLTDNYSAEGDEYQDEFVTDGGGANDVINEVEDKVDDLADEVENLKDTILYKIISVDVIPENPETNTLYVIRGVCRVVQEKYWKENGDESGSNPSGITIENGKKYKFSVSEVGSIITKSISSYGSLYPDVKNLYVYKRFTDSSATIDKFVKDNLSPNNVISYSIIYSDMDNTMKMYLCISASEVGELTLNNGSHGDINSDSASYDISPSIRSNKWITIIIGNESTNDVYKVTSDASQAFDPPNIDYYYGFDKFYTTRGKMFVDNLVLNEEVKSE